MKEYHKIQSVFKRDEETHKFIEGDWSIPEFDYLKLNDWVFTEKIDGTNIRIMWDGEKIRIGGKTDNAQMPVFLYEKLFSMFDASKMKEVFDCPVCLYGEGYGAKIQKGGKYIPDGVDFILFDAKIDEWWLKRSDVEDIANKLNIKVVPIVATGTLGFAIEMVKSGRLLSQWGDFLAEGLVLRPSTELKDRAGRRIITKVKHKDF